jgi:hypothetical protein
LPTSALYPETSAARIAASFRSMRAIRYPRNTVNPIVTGFDEDAIAQCPHRQSWVILRPSSSL